ncbi:NADH:ubiquinone reductase (Na(+)-transporting) subunit D [Crocinitomicaceae bacterium]|jgi:Na+-transporting NADH:ubiquinone oxidoreductase subunit D|nr:NADH:ubiquinone reductase (Na(+)-transporting) subunit D [Crocinitomicaceae bacterium]MDA9299116.1 NADH:ubiquinone reductase (Na(+)-transporting) subunit D [Crocinitomicaceae bacterium]MDC0100065.1 NADH:ubiquinone reductase (Na(+)-transporting) subunit D [Crocinitomicaceae bacterium]MDC1384469.1 NADH:ubiquinone reductase (Na(+)-transporting) subunit D [Crocinitomicaceae bacterium]|tara:strand:+ start:99 stop:788 length:690 start_codon:yes stop_codon:yes gene_type:complete
MSEGIENKKVPREPLFSKKNKKLVTEPLADNNPVTIQVLGICSALAITVQVEQGVVMGGAVLFVLVLGNLIISLLRNLIPSRIRIIVQLVVVAALVIIVNEVLKAFLPDVSEKLSVFVGLIITNCIIMGRFEAFAMANKPWPSIMDGIGNGLGYAGLLILVAVFRELFGSGSLYGVKLLGSNIPGEEWGLYTMGYVNNNMMILPPMALIIVGIIIWVQRSRNKSLIEQH